MAGPEEQPAGSGSGSAPPASAQPPAAGAGAPGAAAAPGEGGAPASAPPAPAAGPPGGPVDYEQLYDAIKDKPCKVEVINRHLAGYNEGRFRTRAEVLERELEPIYAASTLAELHAELEAAGERLAQLGAFSRVSFLAHEEPEDDPEACSVELELEERNWFNLRAATYVQGGESTLELGAGLTNASGRCERLSANVEYGMERSYTASVTASQPRPAGLPLVAEGRVQQLFRNHQKASSYTEQLRGLVLGVRSLDGSRSLEYELGWRTLLDTSRTASKPVMAQMGDYLKSAVRLSAVLDRRQRGAGGAAAALGGAGWALRSTTDIAGLLPGGGGGAGEAGGVLRFVRQQLDAVAALPMDEQGGVVFNLGVTAGLLLPWGPDFMSRPTCISDRFFLGGPSSLRGFKFKGAGPSDVRRPPPERPLGEEGQPPKRDALGGDAYTSIFAALMFQLPHPALQAIKLHGQAWVNGGNVIQVAGSGRSPRALLSEFGSTFRWSCGMGLVLPTVFGRFEANYCVVLAAGENDRVRRGLQLGFAASPLS